MQVNKPENKILQKYISHYYYFENKEKIPMYNIYPSLCTVMSFYLETEVIEDGNKYILKQNLSKGPICLVVGAFNETKTIEYIGDVKVFTICFKGCGLHKFIDFSMYFLKDKLIQNNALQDTFADSINKLMAIKSTEGKFEFIEKYLISIMNDKQFTTLEQAISKIEENPNIQIKTLAQELSISKKTLIQHFNKYIGRSPIEYRNVLKFRRICESENIDLTSLSYQMGFFDQAHMINNFKKITSTPPKAFLKRNNITDNNQTLWVEN